MASDRFISMTVDADASAPRKFFDKAYRAVAESASRAVRTVGASAVKKGRADIRASGNFKGKWVSGLNARYFPKGKPSPNAKASIKHALGGLASVQTFGATIKGKPLLWLPAAGQAKKVTIKTDFSAGVISRQRLKNTPAANVSTKGGLEYFKPKGMKYPLLGRAVGKGKRRRFVAAFIGLPQVTIKPKWHWLDIAEQEAARLPVELNKELAKRSK